MSLGLRTQRDALRSHALKLGRFERFDGHEALHTPGRGLHGQILLGPIGPAQRGSGLASTSARVQWLVRLMCSLDREPKDDIDIDLGEAADELMTAYSGDFELGGNVRMIDLLGAYGVPLSVQPGYLEMPADGAVLRIADITVPVIVNDVFPQVA